MSESKGREESKTTGITTKRLSVNQTLGEMPSEVFVVQFSPDGKMVAAGLGNGSIRVTKLDTGRRYVVAAGSVMSMPCTSLRFRPTSAASKTKNVLLAVDSEGVAKHWHIPSGKCLHTIKATGDNQLFAVDYRHDGAHFATAGSDKAIRIYDEATKSLVSEISGGIPHVAVGHSNRVFSLKYLPENDNVLLSGGWDGTVQVWDLRAGHSVRSINGPVIAGDAMDEYAGVILTGSNRREKALQTWDLGTAKLIEDIEWCPKGTKGMLSKLYSAQFSRDGSMIAAGGFNDNIAKVFDRNEANTTIGTLAGLTRGVFSVAWGESGRLAIAGGDAAVRIFDVVDKGSADAEKTITLTDRSVEAEEDESKGAGAGESKGRD